MSLPLPPNAIADVDNILCQGSCYQTYQLGERSLMPAGVGQKLSCW
ncbi:hypothetical protein [Coleofasciculus sp. H7-2]